MVTGRKDIDTGRAWLVLVVVYIGVFLNCLLHIMSGVFHIAYLHKFREDEAKTSIVGSLNVGLLTLAAPLSSIISNKFNSRVSIVTGGILSAVGYFASAFATSLNGVIVTQGFIAGIGFGLSTTGFFCSLGFHFDVWRNLVLSIIFTIMGIGSSFSAPVGLFLIRSFGLTRTLVILGCIEANICVLGMICQPSSTERRLHAKQKMATSKTRRIFDISMFRNKSFSFFLCASMSWNVSFAVAVIHYPNYIAELGATDYEIGLQMLVFSISNVCSRFMTSVLLTKMHKKFLHVNTACLFLTGVLTATFLFYSKLPGGLYMFIIQLGVFTGVPNAMISVIPVNLVGFEKLPDVQGISFLFQGIGVTVGPIIFGGVYNLTKSYDHSFIVTGGVLIVGSIFSIIAVLFEPSTVSDKCGVEEVVLEDSKCDQNRNRSSATEQTDVNESDESVEALVT